MSPKEAGAMGSWASAGDAKRLVRSVNAPRSTFWESVRVPGPSFLAVLLAIGALAATFSRLRATVIHPLDVTWMYYANFVIVYAVLAGAVTYFMAFSFRGPRRYAERPARTRFLCLIPAYNEENVIANSVRSLLEQDYPAALFEVVVVFNGTDGTGRAARRLGAAVVGTPTTGTGKHRALAYALERLVKPDDDRFVCVFDADNVAARDYLRQMNNAIVSGKHRCLQGFHDVLNGTDNWVTKALWAGTAASSRLYNLGRHNSLGNALICGTGWCCEGVLLKKYWPSIRTQTEDIELNGVLLLNENVRVAWVPSARFFDEKPRNLWIGVRQRRRWMAGHTRVFWFLAWPCLREGVRRRDLALLELALYYSVPFQMSVSVIQLFVLLVGISLDVFTIRGPLAAPAVQLALQIVTVAYLVGYQALGFGLHTGRWGKGLLYGGYTCVFAIVVWTIALVWSWFSVFRNDWIFHTPHVTEARLEAASEA